MWNNKDNGRQTTRIVSGPKIKQFFFLCLGRVEELSYLPVYPAVLIFEMKNVLADFD